MLSTAGTRPGSTPTTARTAHAPSTGKRIDRIASSSEKDGRESSTSARSVGRELERDRRAGSGARLQGPAQQQRREARRLEAGRDEERDSRPAVRREQRREREDQRAERREEDAQHREASPHRERRALRRGVAREVDQRGGDGGGRDGERGRPVRGPEASRRPQEPEAG